MTTPPQQTEDPRPKCRECARPTDPETARLVLLEAVDDRHDAESVVGIYCCADHALDAWIRGFSMQDTQIW